MNWLRRIWNDLVIGWKAQRNYKPIRDLKLPPGYSNKPDDGIIDLVMLGIIPDEHMDELPDF